ncbi:hypothetical protein JX266_013202 [Neoarthrinium moseri]|uniref:uncharacterized protein n=1 Tax=Neoarthrinium moseri TaxID=1658444 RepID=UPI001FDCDFD2|nr:uncharacterized protein JN550_003538 [Neoarthrinium moseri]KAI1840598.1 hypothetical protein JX266_013202 [Neoarthrinium moseri]KAI1873285.1 hypothetical protein JN550_003538 [Neoarthrinium moseri]
MDPVSALGAAGSIVGIASFGIQLSKVLFDFCNQVGSAPESLQAVLDVLESTVEALGEVNHFLNTEIRAHQHYKKTFTYSTKWLLSVKRTADKCLIVFWRIEAAIIDTSKTTDKELMDRLANYNKQVSANNSTIPIEIELRLKGITLRVPKRLRWPYIIPKLDAYSQQLQRFQVNLVLMFQVITLAEQRSKPLRNIEDFWVMMRTYTIISKLTTPEELRAIASDTIGFHSTSKNHTTDPLTERIQRSQRGKNRPTTDGQQCDHDIKVVVEERPLVPSPFTPEMTHDQVEKPDARDLVYNVSKDNHIGNNSSHLIDQTKGTAGISSRTSPLEKAQGSSERVRFVDVVSTDKEHTDQVTETNKSGKRANRGDISCMPNCTPTESTFKVEGIEAWSRSHAKAPQTTIIHGISQGRDTYHTKMHKDIDEIDSMLEPARSKTSERPEQHNSNIKTSASDELSLPRRLVSACLIDSESAHVLPQPVELGIRDKILKSLNWWPSKKGLTRKLAFLSVDDRNILEEFLDSGSSPLKPDLVRLKTIKEIPWKFWGKQKAARIALFEHEIGDTPRRSSDSLHYLADDVKFPGSEDRARIDREILSENPWPRGPAVYPYMEDEFSGFGSGATQRGPPGPPPPPEPCPPNYGTYPVTLPPQFVQAARPVQDIENRVQDVSHMLLLEDEYRKRFTSLKVWTVHPYISQQYLKSSATNWTRCMVSQEYFNKEELEKRIQILDSQTDDVLEKKAALEPDQRAQIIHLLSTTNCRETNPNYDWSLRQIEIVKDRRGRRTKQVIAMLVYLSRAPRVDMNVAALYKLEHQIVPQIDGPPPCHTNYQTASIAQRAAPSQQGPFIGPHNPRPAAGAPCRGALPGHKDPASTTVLDDEGTKTVSGQVRSSRSKCAKKAPRDGSSDSSQESPFGERKRGRRSRKHFWKPSAYGLGNASMIGEDGSGIDDYDGRSSLARNRRYRHRGGSTERSSRKHYPVSSGDRTFEETPRSGRTFNQTRQYSRAARPVGGKHIARFDDAALESRVPYYRRPGYDLQVQARPHSHVRRRSYERRNPDNLQEMPTQTLVTRSQSPRGSHQTAEMGGIAGPYSKTKDFTPYPSYFDNKAHDPRVRDQKLPNEEVIEQLLFEWTSPTSMDVGKAEQNEGRAPGVELSLPVPGSAIYNNQRYMMSSGISPSLEIETDTDDGGVPLNSGYEDQSGNEQDEGQNRRELLNITNHGPLIAGSGKAPARRPAQPSTTFGYVESRESSAKSLGLAEPSKEADSTPEQRYANTRTGMNEQRQKISRGSNFSLPPRDTWSDIGWAKDIVQDTALAGTEYSAPSFVTATRPTEKPARYSVPTWRSRSVLPEAQKLQEIRPGWQYSGRMDAEDRLQVLEEKQAERLRAWQVRTGLRTVDKHRDVPVIPHIRDGDGMS